MELGRLLANHGSQAHLFETFLLVTVFFALVELNKIVTFWGFFSASMCVLHALSWADWVVQQLIRHPSEVWTAGHFASSVARTLHVSSIRFVPAVANMVLFSFFLCIQSRLYDASFTYILSDIFSKILHRKLPGRKFPFHVRISLAIPEPAGAFSLPGYHLFWHLFGPLLALVSSVCGWQPPLGTESRKVITGSEACVQSTGVHVICVHPD